MCNSNAPSQAHLQGPQIRHTGASLAKDPDLFQRFRDTLRHGGHSHSIQVTKTKGEHITGSLLLCWQTNIFSALYRYQPISSRRNSIELLLLSSSSIFQSAEAPGRTLINTSTAANSVRNFLYLGISIK